MVDLFKGIKADKTNANIGWMIDKSPFYSDGYLKAARELCKNFEKRSINEKESLVFPIIFLYRQFIELTLKDIIKKLDARLINNRSDKILESHRLLPLWDEAIKLFEEIIIKECISLDFTPTLSKEREIIKQFDKIDQNSFAFRYATDKRGNKNLNGVKYISLNNFKEQIEIVVYYLEAMKETLCHIDP